ncbi:MAG: low molecular weight protein tyrosine phosphatase family protein [Pseudomonadota bacterium]
MNFLFVCSENRLRSPTAETVFAEYKGINTISAGTNHDSQTPVSGDLIKWADIVFVMEPSQRRKVSKKFVELLKNKKLICLDIPDKYDRMDPALITLLKVKVRPFIPN